MAAFLPMDWGYVSGFFDGEGCVDCREIFRPNRPGALRQWRVKFYQSTLEPLVEISHFLEEYGIKSYVEDYTRDFTTPNGVTYNRRKCALIVGGAIDSYLVLSEMLPYLRVKHEQAEGVIMKLEELAILDSEGKLSHKAKGLYRQILLGGE